MTVKITIYNLVTDTDNGTDTWSYGSREEAENNYIQTINSYLDGTDIPPADNFDEAQEAYRDLIDNHGCIDSIYVSAQTIEIGPKPPAEGLKRFYVTKTWDNFPEGGSCGEIIWAKDYEDAEAQMIEIMIGYRTPDHSPEEEGWGTIEEAAEYYRKNCAPEWETIDCFPIDEAIEGWLQ